MRNSNCGSTRLVELKRKASIGHFISPIGILSNTLLVNCIELRNVVVDFNQQLPSFQIGNIRITANFSNTDFEPFFLPLTLTDTKVRENNTHSILIVGTHLLASISTQFLDTHLNTGTLFV
jgi:hypothetical protein